MRNYLNFLKKSAWVALVVPLFASCSDAWNKHYSTNTDVVADKTIAELLSEDPDYSKFVQVLKNTVVFNGKKTTKQTYFEFLNSNQFVTLWAPKNDAENVDWSLYTKSGKNYDEAWETQLEFIKNHLALSNPSAGVTGSKIIPMMSKKTFTITPNSIGNVQYAQANIPCTNGVIHKLDGALSYSKSVYEILTTEDRFSHIGVFLESYKEEILDESQSVSSGLDDNGEKIYIDSVVNIRNIFLNTFGRLDVEDSTFWVVAVNNDVWDQQILKALPYFDYGKQDRIRHIKVKSNIADEFEQKYSEFCTVDRIGNDCYLNIDSLQWLYANAAMFVDMTYNMNAKRAINRYREDSVYSVAWGFFGSFMDPADISTLEGHYYKPFGPVSDTIRKSGLFNAGTAVVEGSNGKVIEAEKWLFNDYETYNLPHVWNVEGMTGVECIELSTATMQRVSSALVKKVNNGAYLDIVGDNKSACWTTRFKIRNILSGKYKVSAVILPIDFDSSKKPLPVKFTSKFTYAKTDGKDTVVQATKLNNRGKPVAVEYLTDVSVMDLTTGRTKIDTLLLDTIDFPVCSFGEEYAGLTVDITISMKSTEDNKYSNNLKLDCFYLEPIKDNEN